MLIEDMVADLGGEVVGSTAKFDQALALAREADMDLAVLDINLRGVLAYPVAEVLRERHVPFVFVTGYGWVGLPDRFKNDPVLQKPFTLQDFDRVVSAALEATPAHA